MYVSVARDLQARHTTRFPVPQSTCVGRQVIDVKKYSPAPRDVVWNILADGGSWSQWGPWTKSEVDREGSPPPGGVGSVKRLARGRLTICEEVTEFEPPSRYGYQLLPVRNYRAQVTLSDAGGGTDIHWHSEFDARFPGTGGLVGGRFIERSATWQTA
jgi:hypothetical protein